MASVSRPVPKITAHRRSKRHEAALARDEILDQGPQGPVRRGFSYFFPIYTGQPLPVAAWCNRMWLDTWI
jgi:hypothetical protein